MASAVTTQESAEPEKTRGIYHRLLQGGGIYALGGVLEGGLSFLLLPLLTVHLDLAEFGAVGIVTAFAGLFSTVCQSPFSAGYSRYYFKAEHQHLRKARLFQGFSLIFLQAAFVSLILLFFQDHLAISFLGSQNFAYVFAIYSAITLALPFQQVLQTLLRLQNRPRLYVLMGLLRLIGYVALVLYLLVVQKMGLRGLVYGHLFRASFDVIILSPYLLRQLSLSFDFKQLKPILVYGYPLLISIASIAFMLSADKLVLRYYDPTLTKAGLYSFGARFGAVIAMVLNVPIRYVVNPLIFEFESNQERLSHFLARVSLFYLRIAGVLAVFFSLFAKDIIRFVAQDSSFNDSWIVIPILCLSSVFEGLRDFTGKALGLANQTFTLGMNVFYTAIFNVALNFILIPIFGISGAALALALSYLFLAWRHYRTGQKHYPVPYKGSSFAKTLICLALGIGTGIWSESLGLSLVPGIALKTVILLLMSLFLFLSLSPEDKTLLKKTRERFLS